MIFIILLTIAACALAGWLYCNYSILSRAGVRHSPAVPILGDLTSVMLRKENITDVLKRAYESFPDDRLVGRYEFLTPYIIVRDPQLLKKITVKDFEHFVDRRIMIDSESDAVFGRNLVTLKGDEWKEMRSALSPMFTSSKIRLMVPFMVQVGDQMMKSLKTKLEQSEVDYIDLEAKDLTTRYANDVIASCAFGLDVNSQHGDNEFYNMSRELTNVGFSMMLKFLGFRIAPWLMKWLKIGFFPIKVTEFFANVVLSTIRLREEKNIHRPDMINLLMELKKGKLSKETSTCKDDHAGFATVEESNIAGTKTKTVWSDIDLVAQAVIFLFAGYDTISTTMSFLLYELAVNPECQEKLVQEISNNEERNNGKFDYSTVQHMKYLDMVVSEVLRKWPGAAMIDRLCVKDYNLGRPNDQATKDVILRKGEAVQIPVWAYHRDPKYFPNPVKFDPERFSEENKHKIDPFVYMPFGIGPRNCIGSRFALCEVKVMVYQLLLHLELSPCERTEIPLRLSVKGGFSLSVLGGNWLRFKTRK